jgi:anthranilate phosphoribosyltransferase
MLLLPFLDRVLKGEDLPAPDAEQAMSVILSGQATSSQIAAFLVGLRMKGERPAEVLGFARAMRAKAERVNAGADGEGLLDTCGTGGDGAGTFNVSTIVAFVVAGTGVKVAKHGNRSISSQCGSADVMEGLGIRITLRPEQIGQAIREVGIGFLFAPALHPAMKHAHAARSELKVRTVFNLLGPLTNPAGATTQLVGAPSENAARLLAEVLAALGLRRGFVVHGLDGLDEITTVGPTLALEVSPEIVKERILTPEDFGVPRAKPEDLKGGDRDTNCAIAKAVLTGARGPKRDIVIVNAAAALVAAGRARTFREGVSLAAQSIDSLAAWDKVTHLARFTQELAQKDQV